MQAKAEASKGGKSGRRAARKRTKAEVMCLRFSPSGEVLAMACRDGLIHLLSTKNGFKRVGVCRGHSAHVTHMDFSLDGHVLQSNDVAKDILHWDIWAGGKLISNGARTRDVKWATWSCPLGWPCQVSLKPLSCLHIFFGILNFLITKNF